MPKVIDLATSMAKLGLEQRLRDLPSTAMVRGIFFRLLKDEVDKRGIGTFDELPRLLRGKDVWRLYPARELMMAYATTAPLIHSDPEEGLRARSGRAQGREFRQHAPPRRSARAEDPL